MAEAEYTIGSIISLRTTELNYDSGFILKSLERNIYLSDFSAYVQATTEKYFKKIVPSLDATPVISLIF